MSKRLRGRVEAIDYQRGEGWVRADDGRLFRFLLPRRPTAANSEAGCSRTDAYPARDDHPPSGGANRLFSLHEEAGVLEMRLDLDVLPLEQREAMRSWFLDSFRQALNALVRQSS